MLPDDPWPAIEVELDQIRENATYQPLRPVLDTLERIVGARSDVDLARALLVSVQQLHADVQQGASLHERAKQVAGGFYEPYTSVTGTLNQALRDNVHTSILNIFTKLSDLKIEEPNPAISVPIVLVVMQETDAHELVTGSIFKGYPKALRNEFNKLSKWLGANPVTADWAKRYGATPEAWRPFGPALDTLEQLVHQAFAVLNKDNTETRVPVFKNIQQLMPAQDLRETLWELRHEGCVVIIDSLSLQHPKLLHAFTQSALEFYPEVSVITLAPIDDAFAKIRQMCIILQLRVQDLELMKRIDEIDPQRYDVCKQVSQVLEFQKWLPWRVGMMKLKNVKKAGPLHAINQVRGAE